MRCFLHTLFPLTETMNNTVERNTEVRGWGGGGAQWYSTCLTVENPSWVPFLEKSVAKNLPVSLTYLPERKFYIIRMVGEAGAGNLSNR